MQHESSMTDASSPLAVTNLGQWLELKLIDSRRYWHVTQTEACDPLKPAQCTFVSEASRLTFDPAPHAK